MLSECRHAFPANEYWAGFSKNGGEQADFVGLK